MRCYSNLMGLTQLARYPIATDTAKYDIAPLAAALTLGS